MTEKPHQQPSGRPTATALKVAATLPPMPGRLDGDHHWPDRFFVEPSFAAVLAAWRARGWEVEFDGEPRPWGLQAVKGDGLYEAWSVYGWDRWQRGLEHCETDPGGAIGRVSYEATKPTPERIWLVGYHVW